jgi:DNA-binding NarL/FixJ family response regulator
MPSFEALMTCVRYGTRIAVVRPDRTASLAARKLAVIRGAQQGEHREGAAAVAVAAAKEAPRGLGQAADHGEPDPGAARPGARDLTREDSRREARAVVLDVDPDALLDLVLPDGDAFALLALLERRYPLPRIVAMSGVAGPEQSFRLAQLGVRAFLAKPFDTAALRAAVDDAVSARPDLRPHLRQVVGQRSLREVESEVRGTMLREALARGGSRRAAARLLRISRQLVQHIIRKGRGR